MFVGIIDIFEVGIDILEQDDLQVADVNALALLILGMVEVIFFQGIVVGIALEKIMV